VDAEELGSPSRWMDEGDAPGRCLATLGVLPKEIYGALL